MNDAELIVDSFAGGGGASLGIAWATGRAPDIAINHDQDAIEMHAANHRGTRHVLEDVWKADLRKLVGGRKVGLLWLSPDCFAAGTLVLTKKGLVPIEQVAIGDEVLTHLNRWKRVTALVQKESQTLDALKLDARAMKNLVLAAFFTSSTSIPIQRISQIKSTLSS